MRYNEIKQYFLGELYMFKSFNIYHDACNDFNYLCFRKPLFSSSYLLISFISFIYLQQHHPMNEIIFLIIFTTNRKKFYYSFIRLVLVSFGGVSEIICVYFWIGIFFFACIATNPILPFLCITLKCVVQQKKCVYIKLCIL